MIEEKRSLGMFILLSIVTCGIYPLYFYHKLAQDMNTVCCNDGDNTPGVGYYILFSILTCGIYSFFWYYKIGNRQAANAPRYGLNIQENGSTILVWMILGSLIAGLGYWFAVYIMIKNMNMLAHAYNSGMGGENAGYGNQQYGNGFQQQYSGGQYVNNAYGGGLNYDNTADSMKTSPMNTISSQTEQSGISLCCRSGEFAGCSFPIGMNESVVIGRDLSCNIKFDSNTPNISRRHCTLMYDGEIWLTDNGSSCGTYLDNGTKINPDERVPLSKGDGFCLGNKNVSFYIM